MIMESLSQFSITALHCHRRVSLLSDFMFKILVSVKEVSQVEDIVKHSKTW